MEAKVAKEQWRLDVVGARGYIRPQRSTGYPLSDEIAVVYCIDYEDRLEKARLISAAPDLLEALRAVVQIADRKTYEFDLARAAIAKALGHHPTPLPDEAMAGEQEID